MANYEINVNKRWLSHFNRLDDGGTMQTPESLPFLCSNAQIKEGTDRALQLLVHGMIPREVVYMQLGVIFTTPGWLKMHDKIIITGPLLQYLLQGFFGPNERQALFRHEMHFLHDIWKCHQFHPPSTITALYRYISLLSKLWTKSVRLDDLADLEIETNRVLADMELYFPAWDLDINRHMVMHVVQSLGLTGPAWCLSMFPFERLWKRLIGWMTQYVHPEKTMINTYRALRATLHWQSLQGAHDW
jgi:hypothetical protein